METEILGSDSKAIEINLDNRIFGTFAEIGAGQEVARHFFRVGGASNTVAKTMSAYDMTFSDEIYGKVGRYVSRERLSSMLNHEYMLLLERLSEKRGAESQFFVFANTVTARSLKAGTESHGWLGIRFQTAPLRAPNDIILHVRMTDRENVLQQQALGLIGVNLIYAAFFYRNDPDKLVSSLIDDLSTERIEVDMVECSGPDLEHIDNRLLSLSLLSKGLTNAIMLAPDGKVLQPSEALFNRPVLVERGSFRPVTHVNLDMIQAAKLQFLDDPEVKNKDTLTLFEMTVNNVVPNGATENSDFLARADTLSALGYTVMISNYPEYYKLVSFIRRYTQESLGIVLGVNSLLQIFNESFYQSLEGGMLEALGRIFRPKVTLYLYPMLKDSYIEYVEKTGMGGVPGDPNELPALIDARSLRVRSHLRNLYKFLLETGDIKGIEKFRMEHMHIFSKKILAQLQSGDSSWERAVPAAAAQIIKSRAHFITQ